MFRRKVVTGFLSLVLVASWCLVTGNAFGQNDVLPAEKIDFRKSLAGSRPNILILFADDLGYRDLACYGGKHATTPNLDRLARQGARFTDFYAGAPNCSPSRACLLTGRIPARTGIYSYISNRDPMVLPTSETTFAEILQQAGYQTMHAGKWHLNHDMGDPELPQPNDHGFDHSLGTQNNAAPTHLNPVNFFRNRKPIAKQQGYSCDIVVDEVTKWLDGKRNTEKPFCVCAWFHETHTPIASPPEFVQRHGDKKPKDARYAANVENLDSAIGRLMKFLDERKLNKDTLVLFTSDNGGLNSYSVAGLRGRKSFVWEGGIREPGIFRWPGKIEENITVKEPAGVVDILPTLAELAGGKLPRETKLDGVSLLPLFQGEPLKRQQGLFWYFYRNVPATALRRGKWSLVGYLEQGLPRSHSLSQAQMAWLKQAKLVRYELYDLSVDLKQSQDVSSENPDVFQSMKKEMLSLYRDVLKEGPIWKFDGIPSPKRRGSNRASKKPGAQK